MLLTRSVTPCNAFGLPLLSMGNHRSEAVRLFAAGQENVDTQQSHATCSEETNQVLVSTTGANRILCKTAETFKLADLYYLEVSIKAELRGMTCGRIGLDPATGSSLLVVEDLNCESSGVADGVDLRPLFWPYSRHF